MKTLVLRNRNQEYEVLVDDEDYPEVLALHQECKWKISTHGYVVRFKRNANRKYKIIRLHRYLLGLDTGDKHQGDHLNRNKLDNRRSNLAITVNGLNNKNKSTSTGKTSRFIGVYKPVGNRNWQARISFAKRSVYVGSYKTERDAAKAFCEACLQFWDPDSFQYKSRCENNLKLLQEETQHELSRTAHSN